MPVDLAAKRPIVVFVGAFAPAADGTVGGQLFACSSLIDSELGREIDWRLIDSVPPTQNVASVGRRALPALRRIFVLIRYLLFQRVDVVLVFSSFTPSSMAEKGLMCLIGKLFRKRVVLSPMSEVHDQKYGWCFRQLMRMTRWSCDTLICQSQIAADRLQRFFGFQPERMVVVPNWIDAAPFQCPTVRDDWQAAGRPARIAFIAWVEDFKGAYELVAALIALAKRGVKFHAVLSGGGSARAPLLKQVAEASLSHQIELPGWAKGPALQQAFWQADIFTLPSYSEGFPNSVLQAMAAGLPVVVTPVGAVPEFVIDGVNGLHVPVKDAMALEHALETLINDPQRALAMGLVNAAAVVRENHLPNLLGKLRTAILGNNSISSS